METMICPQCGGYGDGWVDQSTTGRDKFELVPCSHCSGLGHFNPHKSNPIDPAVPQQAMTAAIAAFEAALLRQSIRKKEGKYGEE